MEHEQNYNQVSFLDLNMNNAARADELRQIAEIRKQEQIYDASTPENFAKMIVDGYNPDKDFMFLQYTDDNANNVTVYFKDFS